MPDHLLAPYPVGPVYPLEMAQARVPTRSCAYPLYDLALVGWMLGTLPIASSIVFGRTHFGLTALSILLAISLAAFFAGKRDGITLASYFDSTRSRQQT